MLRHIEQPLRSDLPLAVIAFDTLLLLVQRNIELNRDHAAVVAASAKISLLEEKTTLDKKTDPQQYDKAEKLIYRNEGFIQFERKFSQTCQDIIGFIDYLDTEAELIEDMPYWSLVCQYVVIREHGEIVSAAPAIEKLRSVAAQLLTRYDSSLELYPAYRGGQLLPAATIADYIKQLIVKIESRIQLKLQQTNAHFMSAAVPELLMSAEVRGRIENLVPLQELPALQLTTESELHERGTWYQWLSEVSDYIRELFFSKIEVLKANKGMIDTRYPSTIDQFLLPLVCERFAHFEPLTRKTRYSVEEEKTEERAVFHALNALATDAAVACIAATVNAVELPSTVKTQLHFTNEQLNNSLYWQEYKAVIDNDLRFFVAVLNRLQRSDFTEAAVAKNWAVLEEQSEDLVVAQAASKAHQHLENISSLATDVLAVAELIHEYETALQMVGVPEIA